MSNNYNRDLYKILNIDYDATIDEIKASYRKLVRMYHPDVAGENADEAKFKEIQEAYEVLADSEKRKKYDIVHGYYRESLKKSVNKSKETTEQKYREYIKKEQSTTQPKTELKKQKESFSQSINDALDNLFHTQDRGKSTVKKRTVPPLPPVNGADIQTDVTISTLEAIEGTTRKVNILHTEPCPSCKGRKFINGAQCNVCNGTGQIQNQKKINVKIPKGVKQGSKVRIRKEGNKGQNGGKDGDLYLIINLEKGKYIDTDGTDIFINLPVNVPEAVLGADIQINILSEKVTVKIPPLTSSGQKLRLTGLGVENKTKTKRGDVIITVMIKVPEQLSVNEKSLYDKLKYYTTFDVRKDFNDEK